MLLAHEHLTLQDADVVSAALAHFRKKPTLRFPIACFSKWRGNPDIFRSARSIAIRETPGGRAAVNSPGKATGRDHKRR